MDDRSRKTGNLPGEGINQKPAVVPEIARWQGAEGHLAVISGTEIVMDETAEEQMSVAAEELQKDYEEETGVSLTIRTGIPENGDFYFKVDGESGLGEEGYEIEIGNIVSVKAEHAKGAYWATRTILQILKLNGNTMPKGFIRDYPKYKVRGFHLDVARKPISLGTLYAVAKEMAYYKMNDFQVHLNDNFIFLWDYENEETAMEQAYTGFRLESSVKKGEVLEGDSNPECIGFKQQGSCIQQESIQAIHFTVPQMGNRSCAGIRCAGTLRGISEGPSGSASETYFRGQSEPGDRAV